MHVHSDLHFQKVCYAAVQLTRAVDFSCGYRDAIREPAVSFNFGTIYKWGKHGSITSQINNYSLGLGGELAWGLRR